MIMHSTHNGLDDKVRDTVCQLLTITLATTNDLYAQIKQAHWNVKGPNFYPLHLLFDEIAEEIENSADQIAERITALGGTALGTIQDAVKNTILPAYPNNIFDGIEHCEVLAKRLEQYCIHLTENIRNTEGLGDTVTSDLYIELARLCEKRLWFVEAQFQK